MDLYDQGKGSSRESPGLNVLYKLKKEHIRLTSYSKMKVNLAVQVRFYTDMSGPVMYYGPLCIMALCVLCSRFSVSQLLMLYWQVVNQR